MMELGGWTLEVVVSAWLGRKQDRTLLYFLVISTVRW